MQKVFPGPASKDGKYDLALVKMDSKNAGQPKQADAAKALRAHAEELASGAHLHSGVPRWSPWCPGC
ncbi:hypothetical protein ABZ446_36105 [Streptomyces sp. NPDC005813]|uniref:hypothetical protein n=1 Tax=Streptomyces sp. NPDC005813 TaxID=3155592 RepID=UPI00340886AD